MAQVDPGEPKYEDSDRITKASANGTGDRGDPVAFGTGGDLVMADGTNTFAGVLGSTPEEGGESVALQVQGIVPVNVTGAVAEGDVVSPSGDGGFAPDTDSDPNRDLGILRVFSASVDGVAEVLV